MRKERIIFWVISIVICACIIVFYKKEESKIPEEDKTQIKVCCLEQFQPEIKKIIEKSSIGNSNKVVFTDNKSESEIILTDEVFTSDSKYETVGWSPMIVAFEDTKSKIKSYQKDGYLAEDDNMYTINFEKIIKDTMSGKWKEKIYCPKSDTREGELFFDFILINVNGGRYPRNQEEMETATKKANEFLNCNVVVETNSVEKLKNKKKVQNELYIVFEYDIYSMKSSEYDFEISYPSNTVRYEVYLKYNGKNIKELKEVIGKEDWLWGVTKLQSILQDNYIRHEEHSSAYSTDYYKESDGYSYVEIPLKEE